MSAVRQGRLLFADAPQMGQEPPEWTYGALCAETDPDAFHVEKGGSVEPAKRICSMCTVRAECLAFAMEVEHAACGRYGVYAGLTSRERAKLDRDGWKPGDPLPPIVMPMAKYAGDCPHCGKATRHVPQHITAVHPEIRRAGAA